MSTTTTGATAPASEPVDPTPITPLDKFLAFARSNELFSFRPVPQIRQKKYGTNVGILVSLIVLGIIVAYMTSTAQRFLGGNVTVKVSTIAGDEGQPAAGEMPGIAIKMPNIHNKSYFSVLVQHRTVPSFGVRRTNKIAIEMEHSVDELGVDTLAPKNVSAIPQLFGDCQTQACAYFRVKVYPCSESTRRPGDPPCAPFDEIEHIVNTNYMRLRMHLEEEGMDVSRINDISLKMAFSFRRQFLMDAYETVSNPDYFLSFKGKQHNELRPSDDIFSIDRIPRLTVGEDTEMCKIDVQLSGRIVTKTNNKQTSLDLIGQWAAFYGAIFGVASLALVAYSRFRFYASRPEWDNFDDEFLAAKGTSVGKSQMKKAQRRRARTVHRKPGGGDGDASSPTGGGSSPFGSPSPTSADASPLTTSPTPTPAVVSFNAGSTRREEREAGDRSGSHATANEEESAAAKAKKIRPILWRQVNRTDKTNHTGDAGGDAGGHDRNLPKRAPPMTRILARRKELTKKQQGDTDGTVGPKDSYCVPVPSEKDDGQEATPQRRQRSLPPTERETKSGDVDEAHDSNADQEKQQLTDGTGTGLCVRCADGKDWPLPSDGGEWVDTGDDYYWNDTSQLYYYPPSGLFYDGDSGMWYDPDIQEWLEDTGAGAEQNEEESHMT